MSATRRVAERQEQNSTSRSDSLIQKVEKLPRHIYGDICERWKPNMKVLNAVIQYVKATKRFQPTAVEEEETVERDDEVGDSL
jgi:hypothetical protein